jgi:hypothetical protein
MRPGEVLANQEGRVEQQVFLLLAAFAEEIRDALISDIVESRLQVLACEQ